MNNDYMWKDIYNSTIVSTPSTVHVKQSGLSNFFKDYLLKKLMSQFIFKLPKRWDIDYFRYNLFIRGYIGVLDTGTDLYGVIPQYGALSGYNVFYRPTRLTVANPSIPNTLERTINENCTIIKLTPNYKGIWDIIDYYGDMLALCAESTGINLINTHLAYVFTAANKSAAEAFKKLFDKIASGEPAVVQDKNLLNDDGSPAWQAFEQNLKQVFIAPDILYCMNTIEDQFDSLVGIPNAHTDKRERMITDEVNANNADTMLLRDIMFESINEGLEATRKMFGFTRRNLDVKLRYDETGAPDPTPKEGDNNNES